MMGMGGTVPNGQRGPHVRRLRLRSAPDERADHTAPATGSPTEAA
jgi:hypothetical protein